MQQRAAPLEEHRLNRLRRALRRLLALQRRQHGEHEGEQPAVAVLHAGGRDAEARARRLLGRCGARAAGHVRVELLALGLGQPRPAEEALHEGAEGRGELA